MLLPAHASIVTRPGQQQAWFICAVALAVFLVVTALPPFQVFQGQPGTLLAVHLLLELFAVIVSALVVTMAWHTLDPQYIRTSSALIFGFSVVAGCDLIHALTYEGMPPLLTTSSTNETIFFWLAGRTVEALTVALLLLQVALPLSRWFWQMAAVAVVGGLLVLGSFPPEWVPVAFVPGQGLTPFKIRYEYGLCAVNMLLALWCWRVSLNEQEPRAIWVAAACFITALSELMFSAYFTSSDFLNSFGHLFKVAAYVFIFRATFLSSIRGPFELLRQSRQTIREKQEEIDAILRHLHAGVIRVDSALTVRYINDIQARFFLRRAQDVVGRPFSELIDPRQADLIHAKVRQALSGQKVDFEAYTLGAHGQPVSYRSVTVVPEHSPSGEVIGCVALAIDETEKRQTRLKLEESLHEVSELKAALDAHAIVAVTDARGVITRVNDKFCRISQYPRSELIGSTHRIINSGFHAPSFFADLWRTIKRGEVWNGEICNRAKDGSLYWVYTTIVPFIGPEGIPVQYIAIRADITERKRAEQEAQQLAFFDVLTGLPNRRLLIDRLRQSQVASERTGYYGGMLFLDLDNFKDVNDTFGHGRGDDLLREVAVRLTGCVRQSDTVSRFGGDEFVLLLPDVSMDLREATLSVGAVAEKIRQALSQDFALEERSVVCTTSVGIVIFRGLEPKVEDLLQHADMALYQAKAQNGNTACFFDPALQAQVRERSNLEADLRQAMPKQELQLFYQPIVDSERRPTGVEALIRWVHPARGMVSPAAFIPLAEKSGLIIDIGQWVLKTACLQLAQWQQDVSRSKWSIAVNVSARQFRHGDFVSQVLGVLELTGANPALLKLEITESMLLADMHDIIEKMGALKQCGVCFSLDDFGTGYSSLSYLKKLPLDILKIDQSFVRDVLTSPSEAAIVRTILSLAHSLDLDVVAEGVETEGQLDFLRHLGCRRFQGYLFGRPQPVAQLANDSVTEG